MTKSAPQAAEALQAISDNNKVTGHLIWAQKELSKRINSSSAPLSKKDLMGVLGTGVTDFLVSSVTGIPKGLVSTVKIGNMFMSSEAGQFARVKLGDAGAKAVESEIVKGLKKFGKNTNLTKEQVAAIAWRAANAIPDTEDKE